MSTNITEEASRLRSSAASSIIQNTLNLKEIEKSIARFKIESNTSSDLSTNELKQVISMRDNTNKLLEQLISNTQSVGSAIVASAMSMNISSNIMDILGLLDDANGIISEINNNLSTYQQKEDFAIQKQLLEDTFAKINAVREKIKQTINGLMSLLFNR